MNITLTDEAQKFMRRMVRFGGNAAAGFRLVVTPGGCSGLASEFSVEAAPWPGDATLDVDGLRVFLPAESRLLLEGVTVGIADTRTESGFTFHNPNGGASCCGSQAPAAVAAVAVNTIRRPGP